MVKQRTESLDDSDVLVIFETVPLDEEGDDGADIISLSSGSCEELLPESTVIKVEEQEEQALLSGMDEQQLPQMVKVEQEEKAFSSGSGEQQSESVKIEPKDESDHEEEVPKKTVSVKQEVSSDWDVESYRNPFETDEHWELRRKFMEQHKSNISEDELVSLAQAFLNVEVLGAIYDEELMARLDLLGGSIADSYRNWKRTTTRRFTVAASEAIADWEQGISESQNAAGRKQQAAEMLRPVAFVSSLEDVFRNFVLVDDDLELSGQEFDLLNCGKFLFTVKKATRKEWQTSISAAGHLLGVSFGKKQRCMAICRSHALNLLRIKCYKIKVNPNRSLDTHNVDRLESIDELDLNGNLFHNGMKPKLAKDQLKEDNIGFQMLKKLGWGGGPLGKHKDGIVDPIEVQAKRGRRGLGLPQLTPKGNFTRSGTNYAKDFLTTGVDLNNEPFRIDVNFYRDLMRNFKERRLGYDLIFSAEFTELERALFVKMASDFGLQYKTVTYDYENYQFVLIKHRIPPHELLVKILVEKHPVYSKLYTVEPPTDGLERHNKLLELCSTT